MLQWDSETVRLWASEIVLKVTLIYLVGFGLIWALRRSSSSVRHHVWLFTAVAAFALPLFVYAVPQWQVLPSWLDFSIPLGDAGDTVVMPAAEFSAASQTSGQVAADAVKSWSLGSVDWVWWLACLYLLGVLVGLVRLATGLWSLRFLRVRSAVLEPGDLLTRIHGWSGEVGLEPPLVVLTGRRKMPMTWGVLRPVLLLPVDVHSWSLDRQRAAVLHELAHVRRRDCFSQLVVEFIRVVYWCHPLAWVACERMRLERERACDDIVLSSSDRASDYAEHLVCIAASCRRLVKEGCGAVALAGQSILERRVRSILDERVPRHLLGRGAGWATVLSLGSVALVLGLLQGRTEENPPRAEVAESAQRSPAIDAQLTRLSPAQRQALQGIRLLGGKYEVADAREATTVTQLTIHNDELRDDQLRLLSGFPDLTRLDIRSSRVTDRGMEFVGALRNLEVLSLNGTGITNRGLRQVGSLQRLRQIGLANTRVTGDGIRALQQLPQLEDIQLSADAMEGAGAQWLGRLPRLRTLALTGQEITNKTLSRLESLRELRGLTLAGTRVDDAGLVHLKSLAALERLELSGTRVDGSGLGHLRVLEKLDTLIIGGNRMSRQGVEQLKGLPVRRIIVDSGPWAKHAFVLSQSRVAS